MRYTSALFASISVSTIVLVTIYAVCVWCYHSTVWLPSPTLSSWMTIGLVCFVIVVPGCECWGCCCVMWLPIFVSLSSCFPVSYCHTPPCCYCRTPSTSLFLPSVHISRWWWTIFVVSVLLVCVCSRIWVRLVPVFPFAIWVGYCWCATCTGVSSLPPPLSLVPWRLLTVLVYCFSGWVCWCFAVVPLPCSCSMCWFTYTLWLTSTAWVCVTVVVYGYVIALGYSI